jgi:nitrogen regulatory protein P-II 1
MKLIKAYVRQFMVNKVIEELRKAGSPRISAVDVKQIGDEVRQEELKLSSELGSTYTTMAKIELVCHDSCVEKAVKIVGDNGRTGYKGDGIIVISPVDDVVNMRTGEKEEAMF